MTPELQTSRSLRSTKLNSITHKKSDSNISKTSNFESQEQRSRKFSMKWRKCWKSWTRTMLSLFVEVTGTDKFRIWCFLIKVQIIYPLPLDDLYPEVKNHKRIFIIAECRVDFFFFKCGVWLGNKRYDHWKRVGIHLTLTVWVEFEIFDFLKIKLFCRRETASSGDIDVLLTHKQFKHADKHHGNLLHRY